MKEELLTLEIDGIPLVGMLYLPDGATPYPAVCLCHGIPSGQPPEPGDGGYPALAERICREGFAVLFFNFRGSGESGGNLDLPGWGRDLGMAIDYLQGRPEVDRSRMFLIGFSGGAAVAACVAAQDNRVSGAALCACPADFIRLTEGTDPAVMVARFRESGTIRDADYPLSLADWWRGFRSIRPAECIARIAPRPVLLVHGRRDETVPVSHAERLYEKAGEPRQLVILEGAGHRLRRDEGAVEALLDWLKEHSQPWPGRLAYF